MTNSSKNIVQFTLIYNQNKTGIYNYVLKMVNDTLTCEDLVQNIFMKLFQNLTNIKNKESIKYWLYTTARNEIYGHYRRKKLVTEKFSNDDVTELEELSNESFEQILEQKELRSMILAELEKLPVEQKDVFLLKEYGGLSYKEIAKLSDIDENLVKARLYKVRQKLIKRLSKKV